DGHCGLDFWRNVGNATQSVTDLNGTYSTHAYTDEAKRVIADHDTEKPLFLYLSYQAVHAICEEYNAQCTVEAPEEIVESFSYIEAYNRTLFAGGHASELGDVDGQDLWEALCFGKSTERGDVILENGGLDHATAIISGRRAYKLVNRSELKRDPLLDSRVAPSQGSPPETLDLDALMESSDAWRALQQASLDSSSNHRAALRKNWRQELIVTCSGDTMSDGDQRVTDNFDPRGTVFLFDVFSDPCELNNLASSEPEWVRHQNHIRNDNTGIATEFELPFSERQQEAPAQVPACDSSHDVDSSPTAQSEPADTSNAPSERRYPQRQRRPPDRFVP
ncbi:hypothetical protein MTO96_032630, partial [Rhipicephalus appendiculatus]